MYILHQKLLYANLALHCIDFDPTTFSETDLLWLPYHSQLQNSVNKRKAEHLAGRIAAYYALNDYGIDAIPAIGEQRQPLWPAGIFGSISHSANRALAVAAPYPVGIDLETIMTVEHSQQLKKGIINQPEEQILCHSGLPFRLALTLAFSAKESLYKALSQQISTIPGFNAAHITNITAQHITLQLNHSFAPQFDGKRYVIWWWWHEDQVITLFSLPQGMMSSSI